jgi:Flp pilus assembly protein TadG
MKTQANLFRKRQHGATMVEMALVLTVFIVLLFGVMELGRVMYLWNTLQQVTRQAARSATVTDFTDTAAVTALKQNAIYLSGSGTLIGAPEVSDSAVRITYINTVDAATGTMSAAIDTTTTCPTKVISDCLTNPAGPSCIRLVVAQICDPATTSSCTGIKYQPSILASFIPGFSTLTLPISTTIMPAESLGFRPSSPGC